MKYYIVENTGKGFITHDESKSSNIKNIFKNIYLSDNEEWAKRVNAIELTEDEFEFLRDKEQYERVQVLKKVIYSIKNNHTKEKLLKWVDNS